MARIHLRWDLRSTFFTYNLLFCLLTLTSVARAAFGWDRPLPGFGADNEVSHLAKVSTHSFTLKQIVRHVPDVRFFDIGTDAAGSAITKRDEDGNENSIGPFTARSLSTKIHRLVDRKVSDIEPLLAAARYFGNPPKLPETAWSLDEVSGPNGTDRETVLNFALMAANAYDETHNDPEWEDSREPFNHSSKFGWFGDSLRGHVFADENNSTIVLSIKGTSPALFDGAETTTNDKENDNLFFGCCCGQGGQYLWLKVCDCMSSAYTCNKNCLVKALKEKNRYYYQALELYGNVTELYPDAEVWLTGHSLGGSTASLLGLTFGLPVITFQAPGEALPAARLGLPMPPGNVAGAHQKRAYTGAYHFGHTADPIFMGTCNSATSACTLAFYSMESQCHTGRRCVWDTVEDKKWRVSVTNHRIRPCISDVYRAYDTLPVCEFDTECVDCAAWNFYEGNVTESSTSLSATTTSTTLSLTRTETCKTPGWWGCLDKSTTTSDADLTTSTMTITTGTCLSHGWFGGCLDSSTITATSTITMPITTPSESPSATPSSTCETPGRLWGCKDTTTSPTKTEHTHAPASSSVCHTPGYFWGCRDSKTEVLAHEITPGPHLGL